MEARRSMESKSMKRSSYYNNVDLLVRFKDIRNFIFDKTFVVRDTNGNSYSIYFDIKKQKFEIQKDLSDKFLFSSSHYLNNTSKSDKDHSGDPYIKDTKYTWNNYINLCIDSLFWFHIYRDSESLSDSNNYNCSESLKFGESKNDNNINRSDLRSSQDTTQSSRYAIQKSQESPYKHLWVACEHCEELLYRQYAKPKMYVCEYCGYYLKMRSSDRIEISIDPGTWNPMDEDMVSLDPLQFKRIENKIEEEKPYEEEEKPYEEEEKPYEDSPDFAQQDTGLTESMQDALDFARRLTRAVQTQTQLSEALQPQTEDSLDIEINNFPRKDLDEINFPQEDRGLSEDSLEIDEIDFPQEDRGLSEAVQTQTEDSLEIDFADEQERNRRSITEAIQEAFDEIERVSEDLKKTQIEDYSALYEESEFDDYEDDLDFYQHDAGITEAVQTGTGQLNGIPVALGVMDFHFIGGSMGSVVGEKITRLIEYASKKSLPLILVCASGGARMQEGSLSLMQMAKISSVLYDYQSQKKLFYVSILTSPTTGGVTASFGMLADIIIAEPYAYIAFAGKRVIEDTLKIEVPEGSQEAEVLFEKGLLDAIVPRNPLKGVLSELLQLHAFLPLNKNSIKQSS